MTLFCQNRSAEIENTPNRHNRKGQFRLTKQVIVQWKPLNWNASGSPD